MRYKRLAKNGTYRRRIPLLDGGLNASADAALIGDNELCEVQNLHIRNGALTTRPCLTAEPLDLFDSGVTVEAGMEYAVVDTITREPFEVDGELCVAMIAAVGYGKGGVYESRNRVLIVGMDGKVRHAYTMDGMDPLPRSIVLVPVDAATYKVPFFVYHGGAVYRPQPNNNRIEKIPDEEMYAPLVMINGTGVAGGTTTVANGVMFEGFNMLTKRYRAQFTGMGAQSTSETLVMPTNLLKNTVATVEVTMPDGVYTATATVGSDQATSFIRPDDTEDTSHQLTVGTDGTVTIRHPFEASTVSNNITVTASANIERHVLHPGVFGATVAAWFGGTNNRLGGTRLFLAGFGRYEQDKAKVVWSDVNNPLYFPENNVTFVGDLSQRITALGKQEDMLVIFKEREMYYTTYMEGDIDEQRVLDGTNVDVTTVQAYFPITQLSPYIGCDCPQTVVSCRNRLVWLCADGRVYTLASANQYSERNVREIGQKIRPRLLADTAQDARKTAYAADVDGEYWLLCGKTAYTFRYDAAGFVNLSAYASASNAAKTIAWFVQVFDGFGEEAATAIVSDGASRALIIHTKDITTEGGATVYTRARFIHTLGDGDGDRYGTVTYTDSGVGMASSEAVPIVSRLKTKAYAFGDTAFCRMKGVWLTARANHLQVGTEADGKDVWLPVFADSERMHTHFVHVGVKRCHRIALMLETEHPVTLAAVEWHFTPYGYVK